MVGSGIRKKPIPDPGSGGQKGTGSQIRICNTGSRCRWQLNCSEGGCAVDGSASCGNNDDSLTGSRGFDDGTDYNGGGNRIGNSVDENSSKGIGCGWVQEERG
jgi:hypothetical protein